MPDSVVAAFRDWGPIFGIGVIVIGVFRWVFYLRKDVDSHAEAIEALRTSMKDGFAEIVADRKACAAAHEGDGDRAAAALQRQFSAMCKKIEALHEDHRELQKQVVQILLELRK